MRWVGSRFTGASAADVEHTVIASSGDLAYTVGFERSHVSVDGGPPAATRRPAAEVGSGRPSLPRMPSAGGPLNRMFSQVIGNRAAKDGGTFAASASPTALNFQDSCSYMSGSVACVVSWSRCCL